MPQTDDQTTRAGRGVLSIAGAKAYFIVTAYIVHFMLPRLLGSAELFGLFSTAMGAVSIINNTLIVSTVQTVSKRITEREAQAGAVLRQALGVQLVLGVGLSTALYFLAPHLARWPLRDPALGPLLRIAAFVVFAYSLYAALVGMLNGRHLFVRQAQLDATFSTVRTVGILGGTALGFGVAGAMGGFAVSAVAILLIALAVVGAGSRGEKLPLKEWLTFMIPLGIYQAFLNGILLIDIVVMKGTIAKLSMEAGTDPVEAARISSEYVGYYSAAQKFAFVPYQLMLSLTFVVFPMVSRATSQGDTEGARTTIRGAMRFAAIVLIGFAAPISGTAHGIVTLVYPAEYAAGAPALQVLVLGAALFAMFVISATAISGSGRPGLAAAIAGVALVCVVAGNRFLVQSAGIGDATLVAAATGTSAGMLVALLLAAAVVYRRFGGFISPIVAARVVIAGGLAYAASNAIPQTSPMLSLCALAAGFGVYAITLTVLREVRGEDLAVVRATIMAKKKSGA